MEIQRAIEILKTKKTCATTQCNRNCNKCHLGVPTKELAEAFNIAILNLQAINDEGDSETGVCCICGEKYTNYGNNAEPVSKGRCCDECNYTVVIPSRIDQLNRLMDRLKGKQKTHI